ncbi:squalene--hopene cyclase [Acidihalobacter ferrooxydans]|uniref:Squalene--hopene cyclase n=1 Tax=Acidihalobacter ferrooxydans TaxID=1765967 RepID=A0A1P8UL42_9GAMM|nr:squalene--hopene cyclase [Acidihalobacter ferrooxydans]
MEKPYEWTGLRSDFATEGDDATARVNNDTALEHGLERAISALTHDQHADGYWCYELEADCTIPAEYILMMHFMDEIDAPLQERMARYLRRHQNEDGGWPLFEGGPADISCTVKAYYALKLAGDLPDAPHMRRARDCVLAAGGAARANVFTRIALAQFGQVPWRAVPFTPIEVMLFPRWFAFHLSKVAYWSRTVMVPLLILCSLKRMARNPHGIGVRELFITAPEEETDYFPVRSAANRVLIRLDAVGRRAERFIPRWLRRRAIARGEAWFTARLNGHGGLGAIFPAMVNAYEALDCLGYPADHPYRRTAREAIDKLLIEHADEAYCQPCVSPVWDSVLAALALQETGQARAIDAAERALQWLAGEQLLDAPGDWREQHPTLPGGGWAFQFRNDYYPDLDDTGAVGWAMYRSADARYTEARERAARWVAGMQSSNGGYGAFDADNTHDYLNEIPFADHGALLDPPTADVSARCAILLNYASRENPAYREPLSRVLEYLYAQQEEDGAWFGRWGTNYIYGTWSVLAALEVCGVDPQHPAIRRAVAWLKRAQRADGGWGETNLSYFEPELRGQADASTSFHTAWALLGLMAAGEAHAPEARRGIDHLLATQDTEGLWHEPQFSAPGFPRVFYLKYHGYSKYFPLWALARYRTLTGSAA